MTQPPGDRRSRRAAQRAEARRNAQTAGTPFRSRWLIPGLIGAAVVVAAILAIVLPGSPRPSGGGSSTVPPSLAGGGSPASGAPAGSLGSSTVPVVTGTALPKYAPGGSDVAIGQAIPEVSGAGFDGTPATIEANGKPKVILFLAHWCPHCQAEVPVLQAWADAGGVPSGVEIISVATAIDPNAPNYPPDEWLAREGWTFPVIVDPTNSVASAYGLSAFPFWVFVGPDGTVRARATGEMSTADLEAAIRGLGASALLGATP
jgi:thiol-disulfide isomerase/thioredoxin